MAEMTAAEAIAWLTEDKAFGQECYSRKQIAQLIEQQQQKIEAMKCCGNCRHYLTVINEGRCFEGIKDIYRYDPNAKYASGNEVCDKWEGVSRDD